MIQITKPFLPEKQKFDRMINSIWETEQLTNNGPLAVQLEKSLKKYLGVHFIELVGNGTLALQLAIKTLKLGGEIITTPFSYIATTSSIVWEGCKPVFVDIDPETFNIDPSKIEAGITKHTSGIVATHCFGNPCNIDAIGQIAEKHGLRVIYDAAHCFGTTYREQSVLNYGDISTISFHATKLFHTVEGGAVVTRSPELSERIKYMRNFGHDGPGRFNGVGINAKNSEFHTAMGLCLLDEIGEILARRKEQSEYYKAELAGLNVTFQKTEKDSEFNHAYFPVLFESEEVTLRVIQALEEQKIYPRRYFYPSLSGLDYVEPMPTPVSDNVAKRVLCLPLYHELTTQQQNRIINTIIKNI